ncbi:MAG TPA: NAD(P)H-dependent oxidoreductase [Candidatus Saccharimonadales bacterium]|nr:NAD(P)H-dependent oxidoreductase [Candidatus Saccharimonadales bacterium]
MAKIAVFVGSLQEGSFNKKLAKNLEILVPEGVEFNYVDINLPLFNQDLEADFPAAAQAAKDIVEAADGVLFVTPEYNRSIPGVLKNAIDWTSRPWGSNSFAGKPAGIVGASPSPVGTAVAQGDLRHIAAYLGTKLLGQPEVYLANAHEHFDEKGTIVDSSKELLQDYIDTFSAWVENEK